MFENLNLDGDQKPVDLGTRSTMIPMISYIGVAVWSAMACTGMTLLTQYSFSGESPVPTSLLKWPGKTTIEDRENRSHLLVFLHPKCTCSLATMDQLRDIHTKFCSPTVQTTFVFFCPSQAPDSWVATSLWQSAEEFSGARCLVDRNGVETQKFGASTSGHVILFDHDNRRLFTGGITRSRGHSGANPGAEALIRHLGGDKDPTPSFPVFGCSMLVKA